MTESVKTPPNSSLFTIDNILRSDQPKQVSSSSTDERTTATTTITAATTTGGALTLAEKLAGTSR